MKLICLDSDCISDTPIEISGPFHVAPKGWEIAPVTVNPREDMIEHRAPMTRACSCEYCARLYAGDEVQCLGCGAPRKEVKGYYRDEWPVMIGGGWSQEVLP